MGTKKVEGVIRWQAETCRPEDMAMRVAQIMWESGTNCVFVVDDRGRATAMLTDVDISRVAYPHSEALETTTVAEIAPQRFVAGRAGDDVPTLRALMRRYDLRRLAIVDADGRPRGFTSVDLLDRADNACTCGAECRCVYSIRPLSGRLDRGRGVTDPPEGLAA